MRQKKSKKKITGKMKLRQKREENSQQLGLFSAFSNIWQTPVR
jgi:hypothetical protein